MPDPEAKLETTRLGSYTIVRKLARGGMAELFLARSTGPEGFEKLVVLKKILPKYAEHPRFVQLFLDEAKLAASLDHPHVAHVYDMGRVDGDYFFTMEYVHGQDLRSILRRTERLRRRTPIEIAVQVVRNIASALHYAHERKTVDGRERDIVHRDVSPSNILVSYDGAVKLADFGVAKAASSSVRTRTGTLKGKVGYMSPEQARGMTIDRRSDIFSLGVVLWELVALKRLFKCDNDLATIQAIINLVPPPLAERRDDCPAELDRIVGRALAKNRDERYQTAQELQQDLEELAREHKLNQSSIVLSSHMGELFEPELAAVRKVEATGVTSMTDIVSQLDLTSMTNESTSDVEDSGSLSVSPELDDDELAADEAEDAADAEPTGVPTKPPIAARVADDAPTQEPAPEAKREPEPEPEPEPEHDDLDDATDFAPPPVMEGSQAGPLPVDPFDAAMDAQHTTVEVNPFLDNAVTQDVATVLMAGARAKNTFQDEAPTVQARRFVDESPTAPVKPSNLVKTPGLPPVKDVRPAITYRQVTPAWGDPATVGADPEPDPEDAMQTVVGVGSYDLGHSPADAEVWPDAGIPASPAPQVGSQPLPTVPPQAHTPMAGTAIPAPQPLVHTPIGGTAIPAPQPPVHTPIGGTAIPAPQPPVHAPIGMAIPAPQPPVHTPIGGAMPQVSPYPTISRASFDPPPIPETVDLTSRKLLLALGGIIIALLLLVIILAVRASSGGEREPDRHTITPDAAGSAE